MLARHSWFEFLCRTYMASFEQLIYMPAPVFAPSKNEKRVQNSRAGDRGKFPTP